MVVVMYDLYDYVNVMQRVHSFMNCNGMFKLNCVGHSC